MPKIFQSKKLKFQPFSHVDIEGLVRCLGEDESFSKNTLSIPYPYEEKHAKQFIEMTKQGFADGSRNVFRIGLLPNNELIGAIGIHESDNNEHQAQLGYWIAKKYWGQGFATEAIKRIIDYAFSDLNYTSLFATHFLYNPASGKAMLKAGMQMVFEEKRTITKAGKELPVNYYCVYRKES